MPRTTGATSLEKPRTVFIVRDSNKAVVDVYYDQVRALKAAKAYEMVYKGLSYHVLEFNVNDWNVRKAEKAI